MNEPIAPPKTTMTCIYLPKGHIISVKWKSFFLSCCHSLCTLKMSTLNTATIWHYCTVKIILGRDESPILKYTLNSPFTATNAS